VRSLDTESDDDLANIDVSLARRLVSTQFPQWADLSVKPIAFGGWDNQTFHLGEHMTVRFPRAARYSMQAEKEQRWLPKLAPFLPLSIPDPLAMGAPGEGYPWHWSVYRWLDGETAAIENIDDLHRFAIALAEFLVALQRIDSTGGPPPGPSNFYRGGPLSTYDTETRQAITALDGRIDTESATAVWESALNATWHGSPVWLHGDVSTGNLLVHNGQLSAVIDFGTLAVGDPACDLAIAWTLFDRDSRNAFRAALGLDDAAWARGRGWTLWKALIVLAGLKGTNPLEVEKSRQIIDEVLTDHRLSL